MSFHIERLSTPVNGKYGKEMSFNGSTSYAQASSPVIGTTGTVAIRFKQDIGQSAHQHRSDYGLYFTVLQI